MNINKDRMHGVYDPCFEDCPPPYAPSGGDLLVETAGYIPKEKQLEMLLRAGKNLDDLRRSMYPAQVIQDPEFDPTIQKGYDFFDWHVDVTFVRNQLDEASRHDETKNNVTAELSTGESRKEAAAVRKMEAQEKAEKPEGEAAGA